jgi:hypothetical protein
MVVGLFVGLGLVAMAFFLLAHLNYTVGKGEPDSVGVNDYPLPHCFFRISAVMTHETWIVSFLLAGAVVLLLSLPMNGA